MTDWKSTDLFAVGQVAFDSFKAELLGLGFDIDPQMELRRANGLLCYYSVDDGQMYLSIPQWNDASIAVFQMIMGSLFDADTADELLRFLRLFVPRLIAHEIGHHLRHRANLFDLKNLWLEEQIANELALALTKHRWSPEDRAFVVRFIRKGIDSLATKVGQKTIANDSYSDVLEAMYTEGRIGTRTVMTIRAMGEMFDLEPLELLEKAGVLPEDVLKRLEGREDLIADFNATYTNDQMTYMYYQMGWLQVDLTGRESGYADEFARRRLGKKPELLPYFPRDYSSTTRQVIACFQAHRIAKERGHSVGSRYFYKRYRTELLERFQKANLGVPVHQDALRRNGDFLLESWEEGEADRMEMLAPLVPPRLRRLLPSRIGDDLTDDFHIARELPTETDRRLYEHVTGAHVDVAAANTLRRLEFLERSDLFRDLPAELLMDVAHAMFELQLARDEVVIWQHEHQNDVYIAVEGRLGWVARGPEGQIRNQGTFSPGDVFGEMSFIADGPRTATITAAVATRCLVVKGADLSVLVHEHPAIMKRLASVIVRRMVQSNTERGT